MRSVPTSDGLTLAVHEHGGAGRPTLQCHATGFHGAVWEPLSAALGDGFERWALDFRAHGASTVPPGLSHHWSGMGDDVLAAVDGLDLPAGEVLGIGHSMGGAALLLAEQTRPGTFAGLWLFEPITPPPAALSALAGGSNLAEGALRRRSSFPSYAEALSNFASKPPLNVARADALHAYVRHGFVAGEDGAVHLACRPEDESQIYRGGAATAPSRGSARCVARSWWPAAGTPLARRLSARRWPKRCPTAGWSATAISATSVPCRPRTSSPPPSAPSSPSSE